MAQEWEKKLGGIELNLKEAKGIGRFHDVDTAETRAGKKGLVGNYTILIAKLFMHGIGVKNEKIPLQASSGEAGSDEETTTDIFINPDGSITNSDGEIVPFGLSDVEELTQHLREKYERELAEAFPAQQP